MNWSQTMQISKRILLILLSLILCIGTTSCKKNVKNPDEITTSISMPSSLIDVITNNNTEYKIVADFSNPDAKSTAETIANKIYATTGKMLTVHNAAENQLMNFLDIAKTDKKN